MECLKNRKGWYKSNKMHQKYKLIAHGSMSSASYQFAFFLVPLYHLFYVLPFMHAWLYTVMMCISSIENFSDVLVVLSGSHIGRTSFEHDFYVPASVLLCLLFIPYWLYMKERIMILQSMFKPCTLLIMRLS